MFFFFSSRRRHTRCLSDWSSDVCSSDLVVAPVCGSTIGSLPIVDPQTGATTPATLFLAVLGASNLTYAEPVLHQDLPTWIGRSEERRVGKEGRSRGATAH